jgi:hypothetical protein
MPKKDIDLIADELWWICKEYNGIPSQTVDKKAYSKALYSLKTYGDRPEIKAVIKEYNLSLPKTNLRSVTGRSLGIEEVKKILEERGRMPYCPTEKALYYQVKYFFKKNGNDEEVKRLKMIYASGDCCPLYEKTGELRLGQGRSNTIEMVRKSMKYVLDTYRIYKVFPAVNTVPMKRVRRLLEQPSIFLPSRYFTIYVISEKEFADFLGELSDLGCQDEMVLDNWNKLNKTDTNDRH